ncbi:MULTISPECIES: hypothetical protein [unclassified Moorena]|uniref:hypothetical protein n=1 Tax=unclassified Moorena TaxID=2683338 RepID=UPI0013CC748D|nr:MULTISPECIES: hypothetical protein [unclassified Moorena]NEO20332.1 hypothetical protein [Moorena sp. SIO4A5]NEQ60334.1 hypothetical protein [Moorena sp. SIO4A1]
MVSSGFNRKSDNNSFKLIHRVLSYALSSKFLIAYIVSMVLIISFGYVVKNNREIEKYKQLTVWYENLDLEVESTKIFADFVGKTQDKLKEDYKSYFQRSGILNVPGNITKKIIVDNLSPNEGSVPWKIIKTSESINVYYDYSGVIDFNSKQWSNINETVQEQAINRNQQQKQSRNDKIFQNFTHIMLKSIGTEIIKNDDDSMATQNFHDFSKEVITYLTDDKHYWKHIPDLRINNVYIFNIDTGFLISYPFTDQGYTSEIDFKTRPWFRASNNDYSNNFFITDGFDNKSAITGIYIDINDQNTNAIRTLWYKFKDKDTDQYYILCLDIFLDKSHQIVQEENLLYLLEEPIKSGIWVYLLPLSAVMALCLSLLYEFILKPILIRLKLYDPAKDFVVTIKLQRESKNYASKDEGEITFNIKGETKAINSSEQSREAGWNLNNIIPIEISIKSYESNATEQEATFSYEFTKRYDLSMIENRPTYRCIETWRVLSESQSGKTQTIGFFVAHWNTNNSANLEKGLDIKSIYWEQDYEDNLDSLKEQLRDHLLLSEKPELVAFLERQYSRRQTIPLFIKKIDSLKTLINSSLYLQQGKIVFSEILTLAELYKEGTVKAICSLHFLKILKNKQQLKDFLDVRVAERYLIEYEQDEFRYFYDSLDDETKSKLINQSTFKIMVYQDDLENIISPQDDFCIISIRNAPKLVAYSFTDNKHSHTSLLGWISWREVDINFYDELYKCQLNKNHLIKTIQAYIEGNS